MKTPEQHLAELLGFRFAGKGASRPEHWGIPGLLWVEQGSAQEISEPVGNATDHLRQALNQSVNEVASSQGDDVIDRVRTERESLLTTTGRARGAYAEVIAEREAASKRVEELDTHIARYRQQVDQLGELRSENEADTAARPSEGLRAQQLEAKPPRGDPSVEAAARRGQGLTESVRRQPQACIGATRRLRRAADCSRAA